ncbi:uncharacterized protein LOC135833741 [Planococcus citri]|uniref:uncharacterized protein LOC135833741 n=1 Tax=Planococcus citri TaxID=170843 RepID=UPI0031F9ABAE
MDSIDNGFIQSIFQAEKDKKNIKLVDYTVSRKAVGDDNNVSSEVSRLYVNYEKDGKLIKKTYFMKIPSLSPLYSILKRIGIYEKECHMYTTILPEMRRLVQNEDILSPKCYVSSDSTILILEDLRESGYKMINRRAQMDFEHASAAIRTLAEFHALSLKLNETHPEDLNNVKRECFYSPGNNQLIESSYERLLRVVQRTPQIQHLHSKLSQLKDHLFDAIVEKTHPRSNALNVLNHGDYWSNNMLFKKENGAIKIKLVDFQLCRWCSPVVDIMFMFMSSVRFEVFEAKRNELLEIYHDTFTQWLRSLKCQETYSLNELKSDFENAYLVGLNVIAGVLPLVMRKPTDLNLNNALDDEDNVNDDELTRMYGEEKYVAAVTKWMLFYEKNGLIPVV